MITKDIARDNTAATPPPTQDTLSQPINEIDAIFSQADNEMMQKKKSLEVNTQKKKHRKHPILRTVFSFIAIALIVACFLGWLTVKQIKEAYPQIKADLLTKVEEKQEELRAIDDNTLTKKDYYQKQILLLFTVEDLENTINDIEDIRNFSKLFHSDGKIDISLVPEDKVDEYYRLMDEYKKAVQESESSAESTTQPSE
jgi:hypothetical protein